MVVSTLVVPFEEMDFLIKRAKRLVEMEKKFQEKAKKNEGI